MSLSWESVKMLSVAAAVQVIVAVAMQFADEAATAHAVELSFEKDDDSWR